MQNKIISYNKYYGDNNIFYVSEENIYDEKNNLIQSSVKEYFTDYPCYIDDNMYLVFPDHNKKFIINGFRVLEVKEFLNEIRPILIDKDSILNKKNEIYELMEEKDVKEY